MKTLLVLLGFIFSVPHVSPAPNISEVRQRFQQSATDRQACEQLIALLDGFDAGVPVFLGYKGCATMMMADHVFNPISKWNYFKKGKIMLERAIQADAGNAELRFLRFCTQTNIPSFLGYKSNIQEDKAMLLQVRNNIADADLKSTIYTYLKNSRYLTLSEKEKLL